MDFLKVLLDQFLNNPTFQGAILSVIYANVRRVNKTLDGMSQDPEQVKAVQAVISLLSVLTSLLVAYLQHKLSQTDPNAVFVAIQTALMALMGTFGAHAVGKAVKNTETAKAIGAKLKGVK